MTLYFLPICSCCLSNLCSFRSRRQARKVCDDDQTWKLRTKWSYPVEPPEPAVVPPEEMSDNLYDLSVQVGVLATSEVF